MGRNHRVVQGAMPAGGAASCHHYRGHRAQGGCTAHGAAYGQRAAFFGSILIEEEATAISSDATLANQCNEVLKRLLVVALQMQTLSSQSGQAWLCSLDRLSMTSDFTQGPGQVLGEDRFRAQFSSDRRALLLCVKRLLSKVHYRKSKAMLEGSA